MNDFNNQEKFVDTTGAIRSRKSNDRQYNGLTKKDKRTNNDLQTLQKTTDRATRILLKTGDELLGSSLVCRL
jgi:hypothetical protein